MSMSPFALRAKPCGASWALSALACTPVKPLVPSPAAVVITPVDAVTSLMALLPLSLIYRLPLPSSSTSVGPLSVAEAAAPLSPVYAALPVPATVLTTLVLAVYLRTLWYVASAMYRLPLPSTVMPTM